MLSVSGKTETLQAKLGDARRNRCLACMFDALAVSHMGSFSSTVGPGGRQAGSRLFAVEGIRPADILSGHVYSGVDRARQLVKPDEYILVASDTTEFDYSGHVKTTGLGSVGQRGARGLQAHSGLAITPGGLPLGVVHLETWARECLHKGLTDKEKYKISVRTPVEQKESRKWLVCMREVQKHFPTDSKLLFVQDREADMFDLFMEPRRPGAELLVRACYPRRVKTLTGDAQKDSCESTLFNAVQSSEVLGEITVNVNQKVDREARSAILEVRSCQVTLQVPTDRRTDESLRPQQVCAISAKEADPPEGSDPVDWTLITTIPTQTLQQACTIIRYYTYRWLIERLHYVLKSGLNAEDLRFDDAHSLSNALALYYMVGWRVLHMTYLARLDPEQLASNTMDQLEITILSQLRGKSVVTIGEAVIATAKLGGYTYHKSAAPPGVKSLWRGLRKLQGLVEGYRLAMAHMKDVNH